MIEVLSNEPALATLVAGIVGLLIGSFLNVVIHRLPRMMEAQWNAEIAEMRGEPPPEAPRYNLVTPRSACPQCGHQISAIENIPVISWLALRGKCSACKTPISARYPSVEIAAGLLSAGAIWWFGFTIAGIAAAGLSLTLLTLALIDFDTQLLPDSITLPLLWAGLALNLLAVFAVLPDAVIGAIVGYLVLWSVYWLFKLVTGKEGMGYGDFKLLAALGAWLGWKSIPMLLLLSCVVGAVLGIALMVFAKRGREVPMPFGPYLAGAGVLMLYLGDPINQWVMGR